MSKIKDLLDKLEIEETGRYDNGYYIVTLKDSNEYAKYYTRLEKNAINTEYPSFGLNSSKTTTKITNYFEIEDGGVDYNLFLIANFDTESYYIKITETNTKDTD